MSAFHLEPWHWWAIALILVVIEALSPSGFFACLAVAAAITGAIAQQFAEVSWQPQLAIFASLTLTLFTILRAILNRRGINTDRGQMRAKAKQKIGQTFVLKQPIQNGFGEVELEGIHWGLKGPDTRAGEEVRVIGVDGEILSVFPLKRPAEDTAPPI